MYTSESLQKLREQIDLVDLLSSHLDLKKAGASYKACCPFHDEKTPSFVVRRADRHYHCFGCGAHGDAIRFLMEHQNLSFKEAVEALAERYHIPLVEEEGEGVRVDTRGAKEALSFFARFYHHFLLYTEEGREGLEYLFKRGLTLDFIKRFQIGWAPKSSAHFFTAVKGEKLSHQSLIDAGLVNQEGKYPFFKERITFPIRNPQGSVVGFSARKIREETFGGKYINTSETPLFKKSKLLFGLEASRRRIAKEGRAVIVEGQLDCLRLIDEGLDQTVASLGTAFAASHVAELKRLGTKRVDLLFDADKAGLTAASKTGELFQKEGIAVRVVTLPEGEDPDSYVRRRGIKALEERLVQAEDYLPFQVRYLSQSTEGQTPTGKAEIVREMRTQIQGWDDPVLVYESMRQLAQLLNVPEETLGVNGHAFRSHYTRESLDARAVNTQRILEFDVLRWLLLMKGEEPSFLTTAATFIKPEDFKDLLCQRLFEVILEHPEDELLDTIVSSGEEKAVDYIEEIMRQKVNRQKAEVLFLESVQKLLDRRWLNDREEIKRKIHSGSCSEEEVLDLAKAFDALVRPTVHMVEG